MLSSASVLTSSPPHLMGVGFVTKIFVPLFFITSAMERIVSMDFFPSSFLCNTLLAYTEGMDILYLSKTGNKAFTSFRLLKLGSIAVRPHCTYSLMHASQSFPHSLASRW